MSIGLFSMKKLVLATTGKDVLAAHRPMLHAGHGSTLFPRKRELRGELVHFGTGLDHGHKIGELFRVLATAEGVVIRIISKVAEN
jgi:hypothetical protein